MEYAGEASEAWRRAGFQDGLGLIAEFARTHTEPWSTLAQLSLSLRLTFLEAVPEGARAAHGAGLLVQRHARVPQPVVAAGVERDVLVGQAVVTHASEVDLSRRGRTGSCERETSQNKGIGYDFVESLRKLFLHREQPHGRRRQNKG